MPEIVLDNVSKKFGETVAADGLSSGRRWPPTASVSA